MLIAGLLAGALILAFYSINGTIVFAQLLRLRWPTLPPVNALLLGSLVSLVINALCIYFFIVRPMYHHMGSTAGMDEVQEPAPEPYGLVAFTLAHLVAGTAAVAWGLYRALKGLRRGANRWRHALTSAVLTVHAIAILLAILVMVR